jgi:hypothetical protein
MVVPGAMSAEHADAHETCREVELYEDNAGGLYLYLEQSPIIYYGLEQTNSTFGEDAQALVDGDTSQWTVPRFGVDTNGDVVPFEGWDLDVSEAPAIGSEAVGMINTYLEEQALSTNGMRIVARYRDARVVLQADEPIVGGAAPGFAARTYLGLSAGE